MAASALLILAVGCQVRLDPVQCTVPSDCDDGQVCRRGTCVVAPADAGPSDPAVDPAEDPAEDPGAEDTPTDPADADEPDVAADLVADPEADADVEPPEDIATDPEVDESADPVEDPPDAEDGDAEDPCAQCAETQICIALREPACGDETPSCADLVREVKIAEPVSAEQQTVRFLLIPNSEFLMGSSTQTDPNADGDEMPLHPVQMGAFYVQETEVTLRQYAPCAAVEACSATDFEDDSINAACVSPGPGADLAEAALDSPMNCISRAGAARYCAWIGGRLPTEAEWERVARGPCGRGSNPSVCTIDNPSAQRDNVLYPWGDGDPTCTKACWTDGTCAVSGPCEVGTFPSGDSDEGAHDMAGNVAEWIADDYLATAYEEHADPAVCPRPVDNGGDGIARGGSFASTEAKALRTADRVAIGPDSRVPEVGFRCVLDVPDVADSDGDR